MKEIENFTILCTIYYNLFHITFITGDSSHIFTNHLLFHKAVFLPLFNTYQNEKLFAVIQTKFQGIIVYNFDFFHDSIILFHLIWRLLKTKLFSTSLSIYRSYNKAILRCKSNISLYHSGCTENNETLIQSKNIFNNYFNKLWVASIFFFFSEDF